MHVLTRHRAQTTVTANHHTLVVEYHPATYVHIHQDVQIVHVHPQEQVAEFHLVIHVATHQTVQIVHVQIHILEAE